MNFCSLKCWFHIQRQRCLLCMATHWVRKNRTGSVWAVRNRLQSLSCCKGNGQVSDIGITAVTLTDKSDSTCSFSCSLSLVVSFPPLLILPLTVRERSRRLTSGQFVQITFPSSWQGCSPACSPFPNFPCPPNVFSTLLWSKHNATSTTH